MTSEEILARMLTQLADKFKNALILKGGVLLRLLNCPRSTQDLDYVWVRSKKRKLLGEEIQKALEEIEGLEVTDVQANSRGVFVEVQERAGGQKAKIEVQVVAATRLPSKPLSSAPLTRPYALPTRIVATMDLAEAFSHKIAEILERSLVRDLYDLAQLEPLSPFDPDALKERLSRLEIGRSKARKVEIAEAANRLVEKAERLSREKIEAELSGQIPADQLPGLDLLIRAAVSRIARRMESIK